ncbi:MAG: hypothetical protein IKS42_01840 [Oscillospiraceae bacterium]|nr:hypothetical protein [Oscillospiraceae bacterium]
MEAILILIGILWLVSPIVLLILWLRERSARRQTQAALRDFLTGARRAPVPPQNAQLNAPQGMPPQGMPQNALPTPGTLPTAPAAPVQFVPPTYIGTLPPIGALPAEPAVPPEQVMPAAPLQPAVQPLTESAVPAAEPAAPETELPAAESPAADAPAPEPAAADTETKVTEPPVPPAAPASPVQPPVTRPQPPDGAAPVRREEMQISAITVMLSVGVVLIVVAGLLFVLSNWASFSNSGKLATLAAGSVLFFGASALAQKVFSLERTGMAFFVIGAAFLPISVWGAGCFDLLGEGLSGPSNNLLIAFAFLSFTVVALIAVRIYMQLGWGVAFLLGLTGSYLYFARALLAKDVFEDDFQYAMLLLLSSVWALLLSYLSRTVKDWCPLPIARALEPFSIGYAFVNASAMLFLFAADDSYMLCGIAALLAAAAFFSPVITDRIRDFTAIPVGLTALLGFWRLFDPLYAADAGEKAWQFWGIGACSGLVFAACAILFMVMLLTNSLPEQCRKGFHIGSCALIAVSLLSQFDCNANFPLVFVMLVLIAVTVWLTLRTDDIFLKCLCAAEVLLLCNDFVHAQPWLRDTGKALLLAGLYLGCFLLFCAAKKFRTHLSDFGFLIAAACAAFAVMKKALPLFDSEKVQPGFCAAGLGILLLIAAVCWFLAFARDKKGIPQYGYAVMLPAVLFAGAWNIMDRTDYSSQAVLIWSLVSYGLALLCYFTTKKRFHGVRRLFFGLTALPPMVPAFLAELFADEGWYLPLLLLAAAMALLLWRLFANRGFKALSTASFAVSIWFVLEATWYCVNAAMFGSYDAHRFSFTVWMLTALWIIALSILAIVIRAGLLSFVGGDAVPAVMQAVAPVTAVLLSVVLLTLNAAEWAALFAVFTVGMSVLAWLTTKRTQFVLPILSCTALIVTLEAVRGHVPWSGYSDAGRHGAVIFMLCCFAGLTLLLPYLGRVLREEEQPERQKYRSYALTVTGGFIPVWARLVGSDTVHYHADEQSWIYFFVPVLAAGFLAHFIREAKTDAVRKGLVTACAACLTLAFWMQPFLHVTDTYWEGKLHLLPLLGFAVVLRLLYGQETGGFLLFAAGAYSMLRLGGSAIFSESLADFLTVLICALAVFIVSFYVKQKKWFLLGGVSLVVLAVYLHTKMDLQWWGFLLIAGLLLISIAGTNEMLKKRGESLKEKAGRLWEDWRW